MVAFTHLLLLNLHLISYAYANKDINEDSTSEGVRWLEAERSLLVRLATPDLHFWNERDEIATQYPGAFIFNITLAPDNRTLLLNDEPILPRAHRYVPAPLRAYQVREAVQDQSGRLRKIDYFKPSPMDLDYYIETPDTTTRTSSWNTKYSPRIHIDILRASMPSLPGYTCPLSSNLQNQIWIFMEDVSAHPPGTLFSDIPLKIGNVKVDRRWLDTETGGTKFYRSRKSLKTCHIWSWLCADFDEYPYYEYIYQEDFDQYGKKGSMRHFLTRRWGNLVGLMGVWRAIVLLAITGSMVLSPSVYAASQGIQNVISLYRNRIQEVDEWVADEEVEGLLDIDTYFEDSRDAEKDVVAEEKGGEKTSVKALLPHPTLHIVTEKSSIS